MALEHARRRVVALALIALLIVLGTLALAIVSSQHQTKARVNSLFQLRGTSSATFVATYLSQQATRERATAERFLAGKRVSAERFTLVSSAFGSEAAVLLDHRGRLLNVVPSDPHLIGRSIARRYAHLEAALHGRVAVSNVVPSAARRLPVEAIAVPFSTPFGPRVFSAAYRGAGSALEAFMAHTISYPEHEVLLMDASGRLIAGSPMAAALTVAQADPALGRAMKHATHGPVNGVRGPSMYTVVKVPGTPWRLVIEVPDSRLYLSISGWTQWIPWLVFALVSVLGFMLVLLLARSHADRTRLRTLSQTLERNARTDSLTGLLNRRALTEELTRAAAFARRRGEDLSVLMIDLDRFKETNDRFGHDAGDRVLCVVADCMRDVLRGEDAFGRWGGDEFLVLLSAASEADARAVGERLCSAASAAASEVSDIGLVDGVPMSVGAATAPADVTPEELVRRADLDLYRVKSARASGEARNAPVASLNASV